MTDSINQLMTRLFVEQPLALPGSANYSGVHIGKLDYLSFLLYKRTELVQGACFTNWIYLVQFLKRVSMFSTLHF